MPVVKEPQSQWYIPKNKIPNKSIKDFVYRGPCKMCKEKTNKMARGLCMVCYQRLYRKGGLTNGALRKYKTTAQRAITARVSKYGICSMCHKIKKKVYAQPICWSCYRKRYPVNNGKGKIYNYDMKEKMQNAQATKE